MLTEQDRDLIRTAAYGAVTLVACAYPGAISTTKASIAGARVLTGATGQAGKALAGKGQGQPARRVSRRHRRHRAACPHQRHGR
jgi:hypothetical protein